MPSIANLPTELIFFVANNLDKLKDLSSLACTNRKFHATVNPILYETAAARGDVWPLAWASHCGVAGTLRNALAAGSNPNFRFTDSQHVKVWKKSIAAARSAVDDGHNPNGWSSTDDASTYTRWSPTTDGSRAETTVDFDSPMSNVDSWGTMSDGTEGHSDDEWGDLSSSDPDDLMSDDSDADSSTLGYSDAAVSASDFVVRSFTPLHLAARGGHNEAVEVLLDYGASLDSFSENFCDCKRAAGILNALEGPTPYEDRCSPTWSPLHIAICHSRPETAKLLLSRGASCTMEAGPGGLPSATLQDASSTALHHAAGMGLVEIVRYLLVEGYQSEVDVRDVRTLTPFYYAYAKGRWDSTIPLLLDMGANINLDIDFFQPYCTITPLGESCRLGRFDIAERLIGLGANPTHGFFATGSGHRKGLSPLHLCCMSSARPFLPEGSEANILDDEDKAMERMRLMDILIAKGTSFRERDCSGDTPLITAAQNRVLPAVRALIKAGADVHATNAVGRNAVMMALLGPPTLLPNAPQREYDATLAQIINELFRSGARIGDVDPHGDTALHLIFHGNRDKDFQIQALRLLLNQPSANQLVLAQNNDGQSPFHLAFQARNIQACEIFVRRGYIRGVIERDELLAMLKHVLMDRTGAADPALNFVLDLDVNRELTSDPSVFNDLLQEGGRAALQAARLISSRGLPAMSREMCSDHLRQAVFLGEWDMAYYLIEGGADVNATSMSGECPLSIFVERYGHSCLHSGDLRQFVRILLDRGANIHLSHPTRSYARPLVKAIQLGSAKLVSILLERQPLRGDARAENGYYLHHAIRDRSVMPFLIEKMLDTLIESGASLTELDDNGDTPLAVLLQMTSLNIYLARNCSRFVKILYGPGVDINKKNKLGQSIADLLVDMLPPRGKCSSEANALANTVQLIDASCGCKELRFLPQPRKKVRPGDVWRP